MRHSRKTSHWHDGTAIYAIPLLPPLFFLVLFWPEWLKITAHTVGYFVGLGSYLLIVTLYFNQKLMRDDLSNVLHFLFGITHVRKVRLTWPINSDEPIKAWRIASISYNTGHTKLKPVAMEKDRLLFDSEALAQCALGYDHRVPDLNCSCGFYSCKQPGVFTEHFGERFFTSFFVLLKVELYGKIIEHERGYRSQFQRVMRVYIHKDRCLHCKTGEAKYIQRGVGVAYFFTVCDACSLRMDIPFETTDEFLARLAGELGTEVVWLTPEILQSKS